MEGTPILLSRDAQRSAPLRVAAKRYCRNDPMEWIAVNDYTRFALPRQHDLAYDAAPFRGLPQFTAFTKGLP
ncbi:MAG TPA: hypothetical protein VE988_14655 [Gemmataceae bacterium]|nr:hypothetical protein [Gemmataceae bacterium]